MHIKSMEVVSKQSGNVGWIERLYKFETGQKATWHTHSHKIDCFNGMGRNITETPIGQKMVSTIKAHLENN